MKLRGWLPLGVAGLFGACGPESGGRPLLGGSAPPARDGDWTRCLLLDFGKRDERVSGSFALSRTFFYHEAGWEGGMARNGLNRGIGDLYCRDYVEGETATLALGVRPSKRYRLALSLGDQEKPRGPVTLVVNGRAVASDVTTRAGELREVWTETPAEDGLLRIEFRAEACASFAALGLALYLPGMAAPDSAVSLLRSIYPATHPVLKPGSPMPNPASARARAEASLREYAESLLAREPAEGGFSYSGNWYENAYPVRLLLAASQLLEEPRYAERAYRVLDRFVDERRPDGHWSAHYFGKAGCSLAQATAREGQTRNLADVGSMVTALVLGARDADAERRARYLRAATDYADLVALPSQLDSGGFPNLTYEGVDYRGVYSVATGIQATQLALLYRETGDERYLRRAERAAVFLASGCLTGKLIFYPHDSVQPDTLGAEGMGNLLYVAEGLLVVSRFAESASRERIQAGLHRLLGGPQGILSEASRDSWWEFHDLWEQSKRAGMLYLACLYDGIGDVADGHSPTDRLLACLTDPDCAAWFGAGELPYTPRGKFGMVTTGFAGLGLAAYLDPRSVLPGAGPGSATGP